MSKPHPPSKLRHARAPILRVVAVLVVMMLTGAACTGGGGNDDDEGRGTSTRVEQATVWTVQERDGRLVLRGDEADVTVELEPVRFRVARHDLEQPFVAESSGLFVVRDGSRVGLRQVLDHEVGDTGEVTLSVRFDDDTSGRVVLDPRPAGGFGVRLVPDDPAGVTSWGERLALGDNELIFGLTERIVDDPIASEFVPAEVGSLDRRGEHVTMYLSPTMSGYAPFHQSSAGYGLLVDGFMPGSYDVGASTGDVLELEFEWDGATNEAGYHLFTGPTHADVLDAYYALTGRPPVPPDDAFLHWRGRDELPVAEPVELGGVAMNASVAGDLAAYDTYDIPAGIYHFDRPWAVGPEGYGDFAFDPIRFPNAEAMLGTLEDRGWHNMVWVAPWAIGTRGEEAAAEGWLAPNSPRAIDLTNDDAVRWLQDDVLAFLDSAEGRHVDGFFMDRGDEGDVTSTAADVYDDGRNGRQIHNWYPVEFQRIFREVIDAARPDDGLLIGRAGYTGSQGYVMRWGGDTHAREGLALPEAPIDDAPSTDLGLRSVLISLQRAAFMGTPYWGHDIGGYNGWIDREVYARWIEVGFASPLMRFHGQGGTPWAPTLGGGVDDELLDIYVRYVRLRHEMNDYLVRAATEASESAQPMARPLVFEWPDEAGARDRWDEWLLGDDLLVAPVWQSGSRERSVWIPPGEWISFWDHDQMVEGPTEITVEAALDELPMWVRPGSELLDLSAQ